MEKTLVLIKPDAMERNLAAIILSRLEAKGLKLVALKMLHVDSNLAGKHYGIHREKPFYKDLVDYITSTPIVAAVFSGKDAVAVARQIMGATNPSKADKGTIRSDFGQDIQRNSVHGSDAPQTAEQEIKLFFSPAEVFE